MSKGAIRFISPVAVVRLAMWVMPPHRKDWAEAMLNELAYIESRQAAVRWMIGSMLFAIRERTTYELGKASLNIRPFKMALVLVAVAACAVAGIYAVQKPYQQERIKFALHRFLDAE
jgi:hypothetical protein